MRAGDLRQVVSLHSKRHFPQWDCGKSEVVTSMTLSYVLGIAYPLSHSESLRPLENDGDGDQGDL